MGLGPILFVCVFLFSFFVLFCFLYSYNLLFKPGNATYNTRSGRSVDRGGVIGNLRRERLPDIEPEPEEESGSKVHRDQ